MALLEIDDLHVRFDTEQGMVHALNGVSFSVERDEVLGVIGESGCGKSVTMMSVMGLLQSPPAEIVSGEIRFDGTDLLSLSESELNEIRGNRISMIYQDPMTSLNPALTIGKQVMEPLLTHTDCSKAEARERARETLEDCGLPDAERLLDEYPHELSGGMRQRVMIAMALITEPELLIADEPTTALDVTIQAQILQLFRDLRTEFDTSIIFITHDLPVVSELADRLAVMYAGTVAETCDIDEFFDNPLHPYTRQLWESVPKMDAEKERLAVIEGTVPSFHEPLSGCPFASRCEQHHGEPCEQIVPEPRGVTDEASHKVSCHLYTERSDTTPPWETDSENFQQKLESQPTNDVEL
ncbi:ABC transporter ATP-binding protein [Natrialba sp. SSL1]|uniref:ABC transporter ATP-binding protein n=1 Tax=Natrialba sp. SSL1 TaxID=1869245 RepID=UPI0008F8A0DA|nr:ABC transporter ATP-binding protein [Natrialba sp. SSL1]OIB58095.1 peptide ABC transporter ATP-binding protein [Natrialba sp. SSL1]